MLNDSENRPLPLLTLPQNKRIVMINRIMSLAVAAVSSLLLTACNGIFDGIYDEPMPIVPAKGQLVIDATSWTDWYYIDLARLHRLSTEGDNDVLQKAQTEFEAFPVPFVLTGESDGRSGQYLYWFDVLGTGIENNEFRKFTPCDAQPEPSEWSFAVHRNNVRTNGGAVFETSYTSMDQLPESSAAFANATFQPDEWSEKEVWTSQEQMLQCLIPSQGININKVLSSWLKFKFNIPPDYIPNNHIFILRLKDGTYAALQLADYLSPSGVKCWLTINYRYPY